MIANARREGRGIVSVRGIAQSGSAEVLGTSGRRFKSCCPDQRQGGPARGRFSSVDRAALGFWNDRFHDLRRPSPREEAARERFPSRRRAATASCGLVLATRPGARLLGAARDPSAATDETRGFPPLRRPKKRGPFQAVPVMARAIMDSLWNDGDRVPIALVFANEHSAGLAPWAICFRFVAPHEAVGDASRFQDQACRRPAPGCASKGTAR
jgi:hypothetical protein